MWRCDMTESMYETGLSAAVLAFHIMPGMPAPEGELHSHDYRLDVVVRRVHLDQAQMVVDLDLLDRGLSELTAEIDHRNLDEIVAPAMGVDAVTVEAFARWAHDRLSAALGPLPDAFMSVRVWETALAFGGYDGPVSGHSSSS
jgi:6-pyruvoyltetrahydropterin/6-carboxytetrahydropterin synthase